MHVSKYLRANTDTKNQPADTLARSDTDTCTLTATRSLSYACTPTDAHDDPRMRWYTPTPTHICWHRYTRTRAPSYTRADVLVRCCTLSQVNRRTRKRTHGHSAIRFADEIICGYWCTVPPTPVHFLTHPPASLSLTVGASPPLFLSMHSTRTHCRSHSLSLLPWRRCPLSDLHAEPPPHPPLVLSILLPPSPTAPPRPPRPTPTPP